jgi:hypothetical protein
MRPNVLVLALALGAAACGRSESATPTPSAIATPAPIAAPTAAPAPAPTSPPPQPSALNLAKELVVVEPTGELPLSRDGETVVDPASSFRVVLGAKLEDARLSLHDGDDAVISSKGTREVGATTALTLSPATPLVPGSRYHLRVDGDRARDLHDDAGGVHAPFTLALLVAGQPPPPPPPQKKKRRR